MEKTLLYSKRTNGVFVFGRGENKNAVIATGTARIYAREGGIMIFNVLPRQPQRRVVLRYHFQLEAPINPIEDLAGELPQALYMTGILEEGEEHGYLEGIIYEVFPE